MIRLSVFRAAPSGSAQRLSWTQLEEKYNEIQVGRQGSYSIERLGSLELYCKTTSLTRVILVCLLMPLPALAAAILLECLPLRPPSEGWAANWVFWLRLLLMQVILNFVGHSHTATFVPGLNFTVAQRFMAAFLSSSAFVATCIIAASAVGFPVPFMVQIGSVPIGIYLPLTIRLVNGPALFSKHSPFKAASVRYNRFFFTYLGLAGIYPIVKVLYTLLPSAYQGVVFIVLPLWKFASKILLVRSTRELEDYVPEIVAFSVDLFGTLFVTVCMYTSGSMYLSGLLILLDVGQLLLEFREIHSNAKCVLDLLHDRRAAQARLHPKNSCRNSSLVATEMLTTITTLVRNPNNFQVNSLRGARLWSCIPHPMTQEQAVQLQLLEASGIYGQANSPSTTNIPQASHRILQPHGSQRIAVAPIADPWTENDKDKDARAKRAETSKTLVLQGLQLLFHCEYFALVEYVECVVPLVFAAYKLVLRKLPNAAYYPNDDANWEAAPVAKLLVFALLEIGSLAFLNALLQNKLSLSPLYQVAFVLETQFVSVQTLISVAFLILLQYELYHFGADFTLEFAWLKIPQK